MKTKQRNRHLQQRLAYEAARIMAEQNVQDIETARRKAAARMGVSNSKLFPKPAEIEQALMEYQQLFFKETHELRLRGLRETAIHAMEALREFRPRLVGPVLQGTADAGSRVQLHLFADTPEDVAFRLMAQRIPWRDAEKSLVYGDGSRKTQPAFRFNAGDNEVELIIFTPLGLRNAPLNPIDQHPMARGSIEEVRKLLGEDRRKL